MKFCIDHLRISPTAPAECRTEYRPYMLYYSSNLPGFEPPVEVLADEEERGEEEHVGEVGGDAVRVVQHHPGDPRHGLGPAQAQDVPVQPEITGMTSRQPGIKFIDVVVPHQYMCQFNVTLMHVNVRLRV